MILQINRMPSSRMQQELTPIEKSLKMDSTQQSTPKENIKLLIILRKMLKIYKKQILKAKEIIKIKVQEVFQIKNLTNQTKQPKK